MKVAQDADKVSGDSCHFLLLQTALGDDAIKHRSTHAIVKDHVYPEIISDCLMKFDDVWVIQLAKEFDFALYQC